MHVNHIWVKAIDIEHLVFVITINVNWMLDMEMFVWKDYLWLAIFVSRGTHIINFEIPVFLGLINLEEEILSRNDLIVGLSSKSLTWHLIFELKETNLFINNFIYFFLDWSLMSTLSRWCIKFSIRTRCILCRFERFEICCLWLIFLCLQLLILRREIPQWHEICRTLGISLRCKLAWEFSHRIQGRRAPKKLQHLRSAVVDHIGWYINK